jgi:hypothetical protein
MTAKEERLSPSSKWEALLGTLPFLVYGLVSLLGKSSLPFHIYNENFELAFYLLTLAGLLVGWVLLIYDENHHPYLIAFMAGSTLIISGGAWAFLRGSTTARRVIALIGGSVAGMALSFISEATWDWQAYYGFAKTHVPWYQTAQRLAFATILWLLILLWPAIVEIIRRKTLDRGFRG